MVDVRPHSWRSLLWAFAFLALMAGIYFVKADSLVFDYGKLKVKSTAAVELISPLYYSNCEIFPDGSGLNDQCQAFVIIKNNFGAAVVVKTSDLSTSWTKAVGKLNYTLYDSFIVFNETKCIWDEFEKPVSCWNETKIEIKTKFGGTKTVASGGSVVAVIDFEKTRWKEVEFNLTIGTTKLDPVVSACGYIETDGYYTMTGNLTANSGCITINASHVSLDCNNNWIQYQLSNGTAAGSGVLASKYPSNLTNVTVKNCVIQPYTNGSIGSGIVFNNTNSSLIFNNSFPNFNGSTSAAVISLQQHTINNNISFNKLWTTVNINQMEIAGSSVGRFLNNWIGFNQFYGSSGSGISFGAGAFWHNVVTYNNFSIATSTQTAFSSPTDLNNTLSYNTFKQPGGNTVSILLSNRATTGLAYSVFGNNVTNWGGGAVGLSCTSNNNSIYNNFFTNNATTAPTSAIYALNSNCNNTVFSNNTVVAKNVTVKAANAMNVSFINEVWNAPSSNTWAQVNFTLNASNLTFTNITNLNKNNFSYYWYSIMNYAPVHNVSIWWFEQANVTDNAFVPLSGATVNASYANGTRFDLEDTDVNGMTAWNTFLEWQGNKQSNVSFVPIRFYVNKTGYADNDSSFNLNSSSTTTLITLTSTGGPVIGAYLNYSNNRTNSSLAGQTMLFSVYWESNSTLGSYLFSFDNGSGTFSNISNGSFSAVNVSWSNFSAVLNYTVNSTIRWMVYANNSQGRWNVTSTYSLTTNGCGIIIRNYTLPANVSSSGTCFTLATNNTVLNCGGYWINHSLTTEGIGVDVYASNVSVMNCNIWHNGQQNATGINATVSDYLFISGNNVTENISRSGYSYVAIQAYYTRNSTISNNWINSTGMTYGIYCRMCNHTIISGNNVSVNGGGQPALFAIGVFPFNGYNTTVSDNLITLGNNTDIGIYGFPVTAYSYQYGSFFIYRNTVLGIGTAGIYIRSMTGVAIGNNSVWIQSSAAGYAKGANFQGLNSSLIFGNNFTGEGSAASSGLYVLNSFNDSFVGNNASSASGDYAGLSYASFNNTWAGNYFNATAAAGKGFFLIWSTFAKGGTTNNSFYLNTFSSKYRDLQVGDGTYAGTINDSFINNTFVPCTSSCAASYAILGLGKNASPLFYNSSGIDYLNISWNGTTGYEVNNASIYWWVRANVTNASGQLIQGAWVNVTDSQGGNVTNESTAATGLTQWRLFLQFIGNNSINTTYIPLAFNVTHSTEGSNYTVFNINSSPTIRIILTGAPTVDIYVVLYINGTQTNYSTTYPSATFNISALSNTSATVELYQNNSFVATGSNIATYLKTLAAGVYYFQGRSNVSSVQNSSILWIVIVNGLCLRYLTLNETAGNKTYFLNATINAKAYFTCGQGTGELFINGSSVASGTGVLTNISYYTTTQFLNHTFFYSGGVNYSDSFLTYFANVTVYLAPTEKKAFDLSLFALFLLLGFFFLFLSASKGLRVFGLFASILFFGTAFFIIIYDLGVYSGNSVSSVITFDNATNTTTTDLNQTYVFEKITSVYSGLPIGFIEFLALLLILLALFLLYSCIW